MGTANRGSYTTIPRNDITRRRTTDIKYSITNKTSMDGRHKDTFLQTWVGNGKGGSVRTISISSYEARG